MWTLPTFSTVGNPELEHVHTYTHRMDLCQLNLSKLVFKLIYICG